MQAGSLGDQSAQAEAFLMSTHNIFLCFYEELEKKISQLSPKTP